MTQLAEISGPITVPFLVPVVMSGATANDEYPAFKFPTNATLVSATWTPLAAVTANGTNFTTVSVRNRGAAAAGSALPFTRSYAATNSVAFVSEAMTVSVTAADLLYVAGDVLTVQRISSASGLVIPAGLVVVTYKPR